MAQDQDLEVLVAIRTVPVEHPTQGTSDEVDEEGHRGMLDEPQVRGSVTWFSRPTGFRAPQVRNRRRDATAQAQVLDRQLGT